MILRIGLKKEKIKSLGVIPTRFHAFLYIFSTLPLNVLFFSLQNFPFYSHPFTFMLIYDNSSIVMYSVF